MAETTVASTKPRARGSGRTNDVRLMAPRPDANVDAQMLTFEWLGGAGPYTLEVARDAGFSSVVARVPTGWSTATTVYDVFRPDGTRYYWRVSTPAGTSAAHAFVAGSYDEASKTDESSRTSAASVSAPTTTPEAVVLAPPYLTATTSRGMTVAVALFFVVSFLATLFVAFWMSTQF